MSDDSRPKMRTIPEASKELALSAYTLRRLCKEGVLPHVMSGNRILINISLVADILNDKQSTGGDSIPLMERQQCNSN